MELIKAIGMISLIVFAVACVSALWLPGVVLMFLGWLVSLGDDK
jgi:hypothetical protein